MNNLAAITEEIKMNEKFNYYCRMFKTTPKKMRALVHRYYGTPEKVRDLSFEEYRARKHGQLFRGRTPRPYIDICIDLEMRKKASYEKMMEVHESGLFPEILEADEDWYQANREIIPDKLEFWERDLAENRIKIGGGRKVYDYAPEIHE